MIALYLLAPDQRTADLLRALALAMGCTEPPEREYRVPAVPLDPDAEARVDEWCAEHERARWPL
ncbi:MAG: hypothetical protein ABIL09_23585 [Gemmatimonadota bacterium]